MRNILKKCRFNLLAIFGVLITFAVSYWAFYSGAMDPDRYYHLALSKIISEQGFIKALPQVKGLGWNNFFIEKEFLFHWFTSTGYKIAGEKGVFGCIFLFNSLLFLILVFTLKKPLKNFAILFALIGPILNPYFLNRIHFLRPHVLAVTLFMGIILALSKNSKWGAFFASFLYVLSYHAFYLPAFALITFLGIQFLLERDHLKNKLNITFLGLSGLVCGIILNPYFPGNVIMGFRTFLISFEASTGQLPFGMELIPWRSDQFAIANASFLIFSFLVFFIPFILKKQLPSFYWYVVSLNSAFWILAAISPRAMEYAVPLLILSVGYFFSEFKSNRRLMAVFVLLLIKPSFDCIKTFEGRPGPIPSIESNIEDLKNLPSKYRGANVFNCEWDSSPYLFYSQPTYKFIDLLDPSLLYTEYRDLHDTRSTFMSGLIPDPFNYVTDAFASQLVFCRTPSVLHQLENDPSFLRILPKTATPSDYNGDKLFLFEVKRNNKYKPVNEITYSIVQFDKNDPNKDYLHYDYTNITDWKTHRINLFYFDFFKFIKTDKGSLDSVKGKITCAYIKLKKEQKLLQIGKNILAIGGGRNIRIWVNNIPIYQSVSAAPQARTITQLVRLKSPLSLKDDVTTAVCSGDENTFLGFSLSFWNQTELDMTCAEKNWHTLDGFVDGRNWQFYGQPQFSCLGLFAVPR